MQSNAGEITLLLRAWHAGDEDAYRRISTILYLELRQRAAHYLDRRRAGADPQATSLLHETFVRLTGWALIVGGTQTVSTATALVVEPAELVTTIV